MKETARKGKRRRDAAKAAQEGRASRHEKDSERAQNKKRFRKAAREARARRDAAKRAREKFQPTLPSCSSLQMSHVTRVFALGPSGWLGGRGAVRASFFHTVLPGKFLGKQGSGGCGLLVELFWGHGASRLRLGPHWRASLPPSSPPAPRRILTGRGPEAGQSSKVGGVNFPDPLPALVIV